MLSMMHLISLPCWFITVEPSTVLQSLKIEPHLKPLNQPPCSPPGEWPALLLLHLWSIVFFVFANLTPSDCRHFVLISASVLDSSYLLLSFFFFFLCAASLWRGALSLLPSGHFKETEQTQCQKQTEAPKRPQGRHKKIERSRVKESHPVTCMHDSGEAWIPYQFARQ